MVDTVALEMKWLPKDLGSLFIDDEDMYGLVYWFNRIQKMIKRIETANGNK